MKPTDQTDESNTMPAGRTRVRTDTGRELHLLLTRARDGDEQALETLYQRTSTHLYSLLVRFLKQPDLAEAALKTTYVKIWQRAANYHTDLGQPLRWMSDIARSSALVIIRKQHPREIVSTDARLNQHFTEQHLPAATGSSDATATSHSVRECLAQLDDQSREYILATYCEGYSHSELCEHFSSSPDEVKEILRKALLDLKGCTEKEGTDEHD